MIAKYGLRVVGLHHIADSDSIAELLEKIPGRKLNDESAERIEHAVNHYGNQLVYTSSHWVYMIYPNIHYVITGKLRNGKRFEPIHTTDYRNYNIWNGSVWRLFPDGRRSLIKRIVGG